MVMTRGLAPAMADAARRPRAVSTRGSTLTRPGGSPARRSAAASMASTASRSSGASVFGSTMASMPGATTPSTSPAVRPVARLFPRTKTRGPPVARSASTARTRGRVATLSASGTASSRSRMMASEPKVATFWTLRGSLPGANRSERRGSDGAGQGVHDGVDDRGQGAHRSGLTGALGPQGVERGRDRMALDVHVAQVVGARDGGLHEGGRQELAALGVGLDLLHERLAHALGDAPVDLPLERERVDDGAHVVDQRVLHQRDVAGVGVDL